MEGRGTSHRRNPFKIWKRRISAVLALVMTAGLVLNTPLSLDDFGLRISDAYASGSNAERMDSIWATASNAKYKRGESQEVDIYIIAEDNEAVPDNSTFFTLYLRNNTDQMITEGSLTFKGNHIAKNDGYFQDMGTAGDSPVIAADGGETGAAQDIQNPEILPEEEAQADAENLPDEFETEESEAFQDDEDEDENDACELMGIDLQPGEMREIQFEFYTDEEEDSTKAYVEFTFRGDKEDGNQVKSESKFYYSIGLPFVSLSLEEETKIESGVSNDMEIWMNEPTWVDENLEERIEAREEKEAKEEYEALEEAEDVTIASGSDAGKEDTASSSDADREETSQEQKDQEKIDQYVQEAMEIPESKVSYEIEIYGAEFENFSPRKAEEAEGLGWISCVYEAADQTEPGLYYGRVRANGRWNNKKFTSEQGFFFEVTGEGKTGQEYTADLNNMTVHAYAEEGVLPENAQLKVTELSENNAETAEQFQKAADALNQEGAAYDGMMAVDITFVDENGQEIEPEGEVQVSIEMKEGALPEGVDLSTVEVHHLKEVDEETVEVEAVADGADKTDGTVRSAEEIITELEEAEASEEEIQEAVSQDAAAVAEFSVTSFSTFTITWDNLSYTLAVHSVDEQGEDVKGRGTAANSDSDNKTDDVIISSFADTEIIVSDYAYQVTGYAYKAAHLENVDGNLITRLVSREDAQQGPVIDFYNENTLVGTYSAQDAPDIYLVYSEVSELEKEPGLHIPGVKIGMKNIGDNSSTTQIDVNGVYFGSGGGNGWTGQDGGVRQGLVKPDLGDNGKPVWKGGQELTDAFPTENEMVYNGLFKLDEDGYYYYDSNLNFATLYNEGTLGKEFYLYDVPRTGTIAPSDEPKFLPYNTLINEIATRTSTTDGNHIYYGKKYDYYKLGQGDGEVYDSNHHFTGNADFLFGMQVEFEFYLPEDGKLNGEDIQFEFEGDDDVWVFIDDVLVLDMGGVHDSYSGYINFATQDVFVEKTYGNGNGNTTINEMFAESTSTKETWGDEDYKTTHKLSFFYLERGMSGSNCSIRFNLPTVEEGTIMLEKDLVNTHNTEDKASFSFPFEVYIDYDGDGSNYELYTGDYILYEDMAAYTADNGTPSVASRDNPISLKDGQIVKLYNGEKTPDEEKIRENSKYYIVETGVESDRYDVSLVETNIKLEQDGGTTIESDTRQTEKVTVGDVQWVTFQNSVKEENVFKLKIQKEVPNDSNNQDTFYVQLHQGIEGDSEGIIYCGGYKLYNSDGSVKSYSSAENADGIMELKPDQYILIEGLMGGNRFKVVEVNADGSTFDQSAYADPTYSISGTKYKGESIVDPETTGSSSPILATVKAGKELGEDPLVTATVTNKRNASTLGICKTLENGVDGQDNVSQVRFQLYRLENSDYVKFREPAAVIPSGEDTIKGYVYFPDLPIGTYRLVEISTAAGYQLLEPIDIQVVEDENELKIQKKNAEGKWVDLQEDSGSKNIFMLDVVNEPGVELPETGGPGLGRIKEFGWMLLILAAMMAGAEVQMNRRRRKSG